MDLLALASSVLDSSQARRLVEIPDERPTVFVGDTHGDREATERVLARFEPARHTIVFLGDAVDRGPDSRGNLALILTAIRDHPEAVHLLMGNHEAWAVDPFRPADFWNGLAPKEERELSRMLTKLPFVAHHAGGLLALHGALPEVGALSEIEAIDLGSEAWRAITWGDWETGGSGGLPVAGWRRPTFDGNAFTRRMDALRATVLVRSHQPSAPRLLFDDRCLTLFSSCAYADGVRRVALLPPGRLVETAGDLDLIEL